VNTVSSIDRNTGAGGVTVLGLTGAPAAGKSTAANFLALSGCHVVDVDRLGHEALESESIRAAVAEAFGTGVLADDGSIDRAALARVAFRDDASITQLERLVHPVVREHLASEIAAARTTSTRALVIDAALLFEGGLDALCDVTVTIDSPESVRIERARDYRQWEDGELERRQARQLSAEEKRERADHVLLNDGSMDRLRERTLELLHVIAPEAGTIVNETNTNTTTDCDSGR